MVYFGLKNLTKYLHMLGWSSQYFPNLTIKPGALPGVASNAKPRVAGLCKSCSGKRVIASRQTRFGDQPPIIVIKILSTIIESALCARCGQTTNGWEIG